MKSLRLTKRARIRNGMEEKGKYNWRKRKKVKKGQEMKRKKVK